MKSLWTETVKPVTFPTLTKDMRTHVLVIGGGLAGLLCAYMLDKAGVDYVLVEADRICSGVTANTTAKITAQHGLIYSAFYKKFGQRKTALYLAANLEALDKYKKLAEGMDCDWEEKDAYVYSLYQPQTILEELETLTKLGYPAELAGDLPLPISCVKAVRFPKQAQFHPLKFAYNIAKDLRIFEHTRVLELQPRCAVTFGGRIAAEKIIVATHFPFLNKHGFYFLKMFQHRSYVLALRGAPNVDGMYLDEAEDGLSFRNAGDFLLLGGGSHRTGEKGEGWKPLEVFAGEHYPDAQPVYRWATQDCMTLDGMPYIGQYSKGTPDLYVSTGFNKWGMTSAMVGACLLTDLITGRENPYVELFDPSRSMLSAQLFSNIGKTAVNFITPTAPRCPHLGCALKYNPQEHSWDCPCHGSRFSEEGALLNNPATGGMKSKSDGK